MTRLVLDVEQQRSYVGDASVGLLWAKRDRWQWWLGVCLRQFTRSGDYAHWVSTVWRGADPEECNVD